MTLNQLRDAIDALIADTNKGDEHVQVEAGGECFQVMSLTVVVQSDLWVPETVVLFTKPADETDGEADDG